MSVCVCVCVFDVCEDQERVYIPSLTRARPSPTHEELHHALTIKLKELMFACDLDNITSKDVRRRDPALSSLQVPLSLSLWQDALFALDIDLRSIADSISSARRSKSISASA
jgi:hypothetical protein